jgi:phosphoribosyl-ATP pyrophosphohydrolase/phosphoribosyl-AMP cyclohydrolase
MLGYLNPEALDASIASGFLTFYSRSKERLWMKGETSGHRLALVHWSVDCDEDTLLAKVTPVGPTCHRGTSTCFESEAFTLQNLEGIIEDRLKSGATQNSYTAELYSKGLEKMAQKVGEEAVETVIEALRKPFNRELFVGEGSDLLYHFLLLARAHGFGLHDFEKSLGKRHLKRSLEK